MGVISSQQEALRELLKQLNSSLLHNAAVTNSLVAKFYWRPPVVFGAEMIRSSPFVNFRGLTNVLHWKYSMLL